MGSRLGEAARAAMVLFLSLGAIAVLSSAARAEANAGGIIASVLAGRPVPMGPKSTLLLGGMADNITTRCKGRINIPYADRSTIASFLLTAATRASVGGRYKDPDLGRALGSQTSGFAVYGFGGRSVSGLRCGPATDRVLRTIARSVAKGKSAGGRYVESCARTHGRKKCACVAEIGQTLDPNFRNRSYTRRSIKWIIESNPFLGMQLAFKCGIGNY